MSEQGFVIERKVFKKYDGPNIEILKIPDGVTTIDKFSLRYSNLKGCKKIIFPKSLKKIRDYALNYDYGDCKKLAELEFMGDIDSIGIDAFDYGDAKKGIRKLIFHGKVGEIKEGAFRHARVNELIFPAGVDSIGERAFMNCDELERICAPSLKKIEANAFENCQRLEIVDIPQTTIIDEYAFKRCNNLKKDGLAIINGILFSMDSNIAVPDSVVIIAPYALKGNVVLPASVRTIHAQEYGAKVILDRNILLTDEKLSGDGLLNTLWDMKLSVEEVAALYLFQSGKEFDEIVGEYIVKNEENYAKAMAQLLSAKGDSENYMRAVEYIMVHATEISGKTVKQLYDVGCGNEYKKEAEFLLPYINQNSNSGQADDQDICSLWRKTYNEYLLDKSIKTNCGDDHLFGNVKLVGTEMLAPAYLVKCAIVPYLDQYTGKPQKIGTRCIDVQLVELADKAASLLNQDSLQELLEKEFEKGGSAWLLPYGRYASGAQITSLISCVSKWENQCFYNPSRISDIIAAMSALMLSDTKEAMINLDKKGLLDNYASIRGMDEDSIRDVVLSEFGLDINGKKIYDLGTKTIVASLTSELTLSLYDEAAKKEIRSISKKGTDSELAERAAADFAEMKKNIKKVVKGRNETLFMDFLSGKTRPASCWIASYTKNPLLRRMAELVVWVQGENTFILTEDGAIDCNGSDYLIDENTRIGVAHPIEMKQAEIELWQNYFVAHGFKQPFSQIWEPVIDKATVKKDRYSGCLIPFYRLSGQSKHGIHVDDIDFHNEILITFDECNAIVERIDWRKHDIRYDDKFEVTLFSFDKYSRKVNHIVAYLDNVTIIERILKDDTSISRFLSQFTFEQITGFIKTANENNCTNVTAVLLDYRQKHFPNFDPIVEFTL